MLFPVFSRGCVRLNWASTCFSDCSDELYSNSQYWQRSHKLASVVKQQSWKGESISSTVHHTSHGIPEGFPEKECFWLQERRKSVRRYNTIQLGGSTQLRRSTSSLGKSDWNQKLGMIECVICYIIRWYQMRWCKMWCKLTSIYPRVSQIYTRHHTSPLSYPYSSVCHHRAAHLRHSCISIHPPELNSLPSGLAMVVRNGFSRHTR